MSEKTVLDLDAIMTETLDNIPDAPDFNVPPPGEYTLRVTEAKVDKYFTKKEPEVQKQRLKIIYEVVSTLSVSVKEPPVPDGSLFSEQYQATEEGLSYFKKRIIQAMNVSDVAGVTLADMMSSVKGCVFNARLTVRKTKGEDGTEYENINLRVIPPAVS